MAIGEQLKRLVYQIDADATGVERGMSHADEAVSAKMEAIRRREAVINIKGDITALDRDLREARLKVDRLVSDKKDLDIGADTSRLDAAIAAARAEVAALTSKKAKLEIVADYDRRALVQATQDMSRLAKETENVETLFEKWGKRIVGTRVNLGPFTTNLRTLMGVLVVMGPIISGVVGSITALSGSLAEAAAGGIAVGTAGFIGLAASATGAILALKPLATDIKTVTTAQTALRTAQDKYGKSSDEAKNAQKQLDNVLQAMPPHIREIENRWTSLKDAFARRTGGIRNDAVSVVNDAMRTAQKLLPAFARESTRTFHVASQGLHEWLQGLRSPEAERLMTTIMGNFRRSLPDLLHGLGQFGTALARIAAVASDFLPEFTKGFDEVATDFARSTENGQHLHRVIGGLVDQTHSWFRLIGATGQLLTTILTGGAREGQGMIERFTDTLHDWNRELSSASGQRSMRRFFQESADTTEKFLGLLRRALTMLFALSRATEPFAQGFLLAANAIGDIVTSIAKIAPLRGLLEGIGAAMAAVWSVGLISRWLTMAEASLVAVQARAAATAVEMEGLMLVTGGSSAANFVKSFGSKLPLALGGLAIFQTVNDALQGDWLSVGTAAGGTIAGALIGSLVPGVGTALGAALGGLGGGFLGNLFGGSDDAAKKVGRVQQAVRDLGRTMRNERKSSREYARAEDSVRDAHRRVHQTTERVQKAEDHLINARKKFGPNSIQAIRAERDLTRATNAHTRAIHRERDAEKLEGVVRKARKADLRTELGQVRSNNRELKNRIQHLSRTVTVLDQQNKHGERFNRLTDRLNRFLGNESDNQRRINNLIHTAATQIGPRYAKQLQNMSLRTLQFGRSTSRNMADAAHDAKDFNETWGKAVQDAGGVVKVATRTQKANLDSATQNLRTNTRASKNFLTDNVITPFQTVTRKSAPDYARAVDSSSSRARHAVETDSDQINRKLDEQLKRFGASLQGGTGVKKQKGGEVQGKQRGGFTVPGSGDGDRFFTTLPPGAFVLNRRASAAAGFAAGGAVPVKLESGERVFMPNEVQALGPALAQLNDAIPRFAKGGSVAKPVELLWQVPGHYDHLHAGFATTAQTIAAGRKLQGMGYEISEGPGPFGPITPGVHVNGSLHYQQRAIDVNDDQAPIAFGGSEGASLSHLFALLKAGKLAGGLGSIKLPRWLATRGATRGAVAGLNMVAAAAERWGNRRISASGAIGGAGGSNRKLARAMMLMRPGRRGAMHWGPWDASQWPPLNRLWTSESNFETHATNPSSGAYGIPQSLPASKMAAAGPDWRDNPETQIAWGLDYIKDVYGAPSNTPLGGYQGGGFIGMQKGGIPGAQQLKLPPTPRGRPKKDFSTDPGSWYDWYGRAIDFYDTRGDTRQSEGNYPRAKESWLEAMTQVQHEEAQVQRIIHHDKRRLHRLLRNMKHLPKRLRKSEPPKHFHFRNRKKGESHSEWVHAKSTHHRAWKQNRREWERSVKDYKDRFKQRRQEIQGELPDLWQQLRVDLPTRYNEIREKVTGQAADIGLEQTASGQERYQALTEFGGNFSPLGFSVGSNRNRFGTSGFSYAGGGPRGTRTPGVVPGIGATAPRAMAAGPSAGGPVTHDNRKTVNVNNTYLHPPKDPHTWSQSLKHELGALS